MEIVASDLAFNSSGCGMWRTAPEDTLEQAKTRMWLSAANMLIVAVSTAIRDTVDSTVQGTIYQRTKESVGMLMAHPENPGVSQEAMDRYLALLAGE